MATLARFDTPAGIAEPDEAAHDAWHGVVQPIVAEYAAEFAQFYDPTKTDTPAGSTTAAIGWPAFPAPLLRGATSETERWSKAEDRDAQVEYCEWSAERDGDGKITRVTFTTEVPEFWAHVAAHDPDRLLAMYHECVDDRVELADLFDNGQYDPRNTWNTKPARRPAHLSQKNNTLAAAIDLAARATVQRVDGSGRRVSDQQILVRCADLGDEFRNSDPRIAAAVNDAAASGAEITLQDPVGLYLHELRTAGMVTPDRGPDRADPSTFWTVERGTSDRAVRASFAVPPEMGFTVGHILLDGRPIAFGAQLADRVTVRLTAVVKTAAHDPQPEPCTRPL